MMPGVGDSLIGKKFAGCLIEAELGRGGMAVVYLGEQQELGRKVALKVIAPDLANDEVFRERFIRESMLAASIDHPNIIPIYTAGQSGRELYLQMRYVVGTDLQKLLLDRGSLAPPLILDVVEQTANALEAAHARGLVHRDVKPANILLDPQGRPGHEFHVYLADFGLTKEVDSHSGLTEPGSFLGTLDYVAPEQIKGDDVDGRADVYALGCIVYQCLSGSVPFTKTEALAKIYQHLEEPPPRLSTVRGDLPRKLDDVIGRALAKSPDERFGDCGELVAACSDILGIELSPRSRLEMRAREWVAADEDRSLLLQRGELKRAEALLADTAEHDPSAIEARFLLESRKAASMRQRLTILAVTAAFVITAALGIVALQQRNQAEAAQRVADLQSQRASTQLRLANKRALESRARATQAIANRESVIDRRAAHVFALRAERIADLGGDVGIEALDVPPATFPEVIVSTDGASVVTIDGRGRATIWDATTGRPIKVLDTRPDKAGPNRATAIAYSSDGSTIVVGTDDDRLFAFDAAGKVVQSDVVESGEIEGVQGDGAVLDVAVIGEGEFAIVGTSKGVFAWDVEKGAPVSARTPEPFTSLTNVPFDATPAAEVSITPGGSERADEMLLTRGPSDGLITPLACDIGDGVSRSFVHRGLLAGILSPTDARAFTSTEEGESRILELTVRTEDEGSFNPRQTGFTPGGDRICVVKVTRRRPLDASGDRVLAAAFSRDGTLIAAGDVNGETRVYDADGALAVPPLAGDAAVLDVDFDPDGRYMATGDVEGVVRIWDVVAGRQVGESEMKSGIAGLAFAPTGEFVAVIGLDGHARILELPSVDLLVELRGA
jgi:serine/threonine-protein kinase